MDLDSTTQFGKPGAVRVRRDEQRAFLLRSVDELNSSLDPEKTLATVARMSVPGLADWCAVDLVEDGRLQRVAVAHVDPAKISFVEELEVMLRICRRARLPVHFWHMLRHSFGTHAALFGVNPQGEADPDRRILKMLGARGSHVAASQLAENERAAKSAA